MCNKASRVKCQLRNLVVDRDIWVFTVKFFKFFCVFVNFHNRRLGKNKAGDGVQRDLIWREGIWKGLWSKVTFEQRHADI